MIIAYIIGFISVLFAYLSRFKDVNWGLKASVFVIFIFLALRYDFGNDYLDYLKMYNQMTSKHFNLANLKGNEIGWLVINRMFKPLGFFSLIIFLASFNCFVLYRFIKKHVNQKYYWFAIFAYVFEPNNMLIMSSAMRQTVAISFFLIAIDCLLQRKRIKYLLLITIATLFHTSAIFLYPFVFLIDINKKLNFKYLIVVFGLLLGLLAYSESLLVHINQYIINYFEFYTVYLKESGKKNIINLGLIVNMIIYLIVVFMSQNEEDYEINMFFKLAIASLFLLPLSFVMDFLSRLSFYFILPVMIVVFPIVFEKFKTKILKFSFMGLVVLFTSYRFYAFFYNEVWHEKFMQYQTIFSATRFL